MPDVPLYDIVSRILPGDCVTLLLQAALWQSADARGAWDRWRQSIGSLAEFLRLEQHGLKRLLPLLEHNLRLKRVPLDREAGPILRAAALREEVRFRSFSSHGHAGLEGLAAAGIEPIVLKGAAAAALHYPSPVIRHCHNIDILVDPEEMARAATALSATGFPTAEPIGDTGSMRFIHRSGLPMECHRSSVLAPCYPVDLDALRAQSRSAVILGSNCRVLGAGDMLAQLCGQAIQNPRGRSMVWLADAYLLIRREEGLWVSFLQAATAMRVELPAVAVLTYLRDRLNAPVPESILSELCREAETTSAERRQFALESVHSGEAQRARNLWRSSSWRSRVAILRWLFLPRGVVLTKQLLRCGALKSHRLKLGVRTIVEGWKTHVVASIARLSRLSRRLRGTLRTRILAWRG
jgi:hypothetical protein